MLTTFNIAARNLFQARRRNGLLSAALVVTALLFVTLLGLSNGMNSTLMESTVLLTSGHVNIGGFYKNTSHSAVPVIADAVGIRKLIEGQVDGVQYVAERHRGWCKVVGDGGTLFATINGIDVPDEPQLMQRLSALAQRGHGKGDPQELQEANTAVLFQSQADKLKVAVGDSITLSARSVAGRMNAVDVRVVAVLNDSGPLSAWNVFVPKPIMQELYELQPGAAGVLMLYLDAMQQSELALQQVQGLLTGGGHQVLGRDPRPFWTKLESVVAEPWTGQRIDLSTWNDEVSSAKGLIDGLAALSVLLTVLLATLIAVGIGSAMWISVHERTAEIGTMRALGMRRGAALRLILCEAAILGAAATFTGGVLALVLAIVTALLEVHVPETVAREFLMTDVLRLEPSLGHLIAAVIVFTVITVVASFAPALRAARIRPAIAMQR